MPMNRWQVARLGASTQRPQQLVAFFCPPPYAVICHKQPAQRPMYTATARLRAQCSVSTLAGPAAGCIAFMPQSSSSLHGVVLVLFASVLWGTTGTAHSFAPAGMPPFWVGALRLVMAAAFFVLLGRLMRDSAAARTTPLNWSRLLLCAVCMVTYNMAFFAGLQHTGVGLGTAVAIGSSPIWAGLLQAIIVRCWPRPMWWLGTAIGVAGGLLMTLGKTGDLQASLSGLALCLLAGLAYGAYAVISQPLLLQSGIARVNAWVFFTAALISLPIAAVLGGQPQADAQGWAVVVYLGVVATGVAYLLFSMGLRTISAATSVALSKFEPITAFVLSIWVVGENPSWLALAGLALVLLGLWLVVHSEMRQNRQPSPSASS